MSAGRGLPLLSGPPPLPASDLHEPSCRKCDKEFNLIFSRPRRCNHCGYAYCHSCTDFQALMPRSGSESGYDPTPICAFCAENLSITAGGRGYLRDVSLSRLKKYATAYNIKIDGVLEKDELIDKIVAARAPNGCLPSWNEAYYRGRSVPNRSTERPRGLFTRAMDAMGGERATQTGEDPFLNPPYQPRTRTTSQPSSFPRPDLDPRQQHQSEQSQRRAPSQQAQSQPQTRNTSYTNTPPSGPPPTFVAPQPQREPSPIRPPSWVNLGSNSPNQPHLNVPNPGVQSRPRSASAPRSPRVASPPLAVYELEQLLDMPPERISKLSISNLKSILTTNHVNARLVVEKEELVAKVKALVEDERQERADAIRRAVEEEEEMRWRTAGPGGSSEQSGTNIEEILGNRNEHNGGTEDDEPPTPPPKPASANSGQSPPKSRAPGAHVERSGLCVVCQDEEANIAIVDCGHLALCRSCSDLVMSTSRECPLCRTRIVTETRLLRIFKS